MQGSPLRPVGYVMLGLGAVAVGVGSYFGINSNAIRTTVKADLAAGGYDPAELYNRDQSAISSARLANIMLISGGAVAATGLLFVIIGKDVAVVPGAGGGVTVSGKF
jgi:hypothetical protein